METPLFKIDAETAKEVFDQADEQARDYLASALYYRELETIRRNQPLFDPQRFLVKEVGLYDHAKDQQQPTAAGPATGSGNVNMHTVVTPLTDRRGYY